MGEPGTTWSNPRTPSYPASCSKRGGWTPGRCAAASVQGASDRGSSSLIFSWCSASSAVCDPRPVGSQSLGWLRTYDGPGPDASALAHLGGVPDCRVGERERARGPLDRDDRASLRTISPRPEAGLPPPGRKAGHRRACSRGDVCPENLSAAAVSAVPSSSRTRPPRPAQGNSRRSRSESTACGVEPAAGSGERRRGTSLDARRIVLRSTTQNGPTEGCPGCARSSAES